MIGSLILVHTIPVENKHLQNDALAIFHESTMPLSPEGDLGVDGLVLDIVQQR